MAVSTHFPLVTVCTHPLAQHALTELRNKHTTSGAFRSAMQRVAQVLLVEATRNLPLTHQAIETPLQAMQAPVLDESRPLFLVPILRAGLAFSDIASQWLPHSKIFHLGLYRDENTLRPVEYYNRLPEHLGNIAPRVILLDPMLATGGSAEACIHLLLERGVKEEDISLLCLLAAPEGVKRLCDTFPKLSIVTAAIDERLNEKGYIMPGLGDAGDRTFGT